MKVSIEKILRDYLTESQKKFGGKGLAYFITHDFKTTVQNEANIDTGQYEVHGSAGQGNWTKIPWLAIFDKQITTTAQQGLYIVYLFKADMSGVYLSLNQGWTYFKETSNVKEGKKKIQKAALGFRTLINSASQNNFSFDEIDLAGKNTLSKGYELGHIYGKLYVKGNIPSNDVLVDDLKKMIDIYKSLKLQMNGKSYVDFLGVAYKEVDIVNRGIEESYQEEIEKAKPKKIPVKPAAPPKKIYKRGIPTWKRNGGTARSALEASDYKCEVDSSHVTFTSATTNKNFVEAHHLIPMEFQDEFKYTLDVPGNIVALCPNCHRKIHYATASEKRTILRTLFNKRRVVLQNYGIKITFEKLLKFYIKN